MNNEQQANRFHEAADLAEFLAEKLQECAKENPYATFLLEKAEKAATDAWAYRATALALEDAK